MPRRWTHFLSSRQGCDAASKIDVSSFCSALAHFGRGNEISRRRSRIPNDLIRAVTEGGAVFLCGAGVSMRVRMPSFKGLAEQVYHKLGEVYTSEPAERRAFERGEYDRALRSLEKRTHQPGTPSRVRVAVAELLYAAPGVRAPDHLALLQLSRDGEGRPKLLTTNFDTLFERAAQAASLSAPSHAGKAIPKPGGARVYGVLHLHGRLGDTILGLPETDFLTSGFWRRLSPRWVGLPIS